MQSTLSSQYSCCRLQFHLLQITMNQKKKKIKKIKKINKISLIDDLVTIFMPASIADFLLVELAQPIYLM